MNNNVSPEKKDAVLKSLAIAGFIGIIILIAWVSVQLINVLPSAFSSLASLAEGLNQYQEAQIESESLETPVELDSFAVTSNKTLANTGEEVVVSWEKAENPGSYTFTYECTDGVAVDLIGVEGLKSISCGTNYNVGNTTSLALSVDSEKSQYADLQYTISFLRTNDTTPRAAGSASLAIVNPTFNEQVATIEELAEEVVVEIEESPTPVKPTTPTVLTPATPTFTQEYTYAIPTSDPNGQVDLTTRFLNIGTIVNNTFVVGSVEQEDDGAIQFEIKNIGTKTSEDWTFTVSLPNGDTYTSTTQEPLKPNERAVLTIGFTTTDQGTFTFVVKAKTTPDRNTQNNSFSQPIQFVN